MGQLVVFYFHCFQVPIRITVLWCVEGKMKGTSGPLSDNWAYLMVFLQSRTGGVSCLWDPPHCLVHSFTKQTAVSEVLILYVKLYQSDVGHVGRHILSLYFSLSPVPKFSLQAWKQIKKSYFVGSPGKWHTFVGEERETFSGEGCLEGLLCNRKNNDGCGFFSRLQG